ncbi:ABC-type antimicrobial peptide transport system permease subunit [Ewingella americana]
MIIFILRRLLLLMITLFLLSMVAFSLSYFTPNAPLRGASLWDAYRFYFTGLFQFDFGVSSINGENISSQLKAVFPATMELCVLAFTLALLVGIPLGITAGVMRGKWARRGHQHAGPARLLHSGVLAGPAADAVLLATARLAASVRAAGFALSIEDGNRADAG